jgi:hypothetical protein
MLLSTYYAATASGLIADISAANKAGGSNTIVLTAPTTSPYVLTAVNNTTDGPTGLPVISKKDSLTIVGNGDTIERSTASGTPAFRLFEVASGGSLTLENLTLQNGLAQAAKATAYSADGGAIYNQGTLVLSGVTVQSNTASGSGGGNAAGGGLWSNCSLTLENSTAILANSATGDPNGYAGNAYGGGIYLAGGTASITGTTFSFNMAQGGPAYGTVGSVGGSAYGGAVYVAAGTVTLSADTLESNTAQGGLPYSNGGEAGQYGNGNGGALYVAGGNATLTNDYVISNLANGYDVANCTGGIFIASGASVSVDSFTVKNIYGNSTYSAAFKSYVQDPQILGTYVLLT